MSQNTLPALGLVAAVLVASVAGAALFLGVGSADAAAADGPANRTITVTAQGSAEAAPDQAIIHVAVVAEGDDPAAVRDELRNGTERLRSALEDAGVADDAIRTADYGIRETHRKREEPGEQAAYRGQHALEVTLNGTDRVGAVVDAAAGAGAQVQHVTFTLSEETRAELRDAALKDAVDDAERQAETLAGASDLEVTGVVSIDATERRYHPVRYEAAATTTAESGTEIATGDVTVTTSVRVQFNASEA